MKKKSSSKWKSMSDEQKLVEVKTVISHMSNGTDMPAAKFFDDNRPKWMPGSWAIANRWGEGKWSNVALLCNLIPGKPGNRLKKDQAQNEREEEIVNQMKVNCDYSDHIKFKGPVLKTIYHTQNYRWETVTSYEMI